MKINIRLHNLYSKHFDSALSNKSDLSVSSPLLIKIDEEKYLNSSRKVMIFGQETFGWHKEFGSKHIDELMNKYDDYMNKNRKKNTRAFWKGFNYFKEEIDKLSNGRDNYYIWNNIVKFGKVGERGMTEGIRNFERKNFSVISDEVKILKPDMIVFFTGPNRDKDIKFNFEDVSFDSCGYPKTIQDKRKKIGVR